MCRRLCATMPSFISDWYPTVSGHVVGLSNLSRRLYGMFPFDSPCQTYLSTTS